MSEETPKKTRSPKKVKCKFIASPTGLTGLAYNIGEEGLFNKNQADELVLAELAVIVK